MDSAGKLMTREEAAAWRGTVPGGTRREEAGRIIGKASDKIESILGYIDEPELIHRDNMVVL